MDDEATSYTCAFCGGDVGDDPRWVRINLSWDHSEASQQFGAHFLCLESALAPGFPLYDGLD